MKTYFKVQAFLVSVALCGAVHALATQEREASASPSRSIKSDVLVVESHLHKVSAETKKIVKALDLSQ